MALNLHRNNCVTWLNLSQLRKVFATQLNCCVIVFLFKVDRRAKWSFSVIQSAIQNRYATVLTTVACSLLRLDPARSTAFQIRMVYLSIAFRVYDFSSSVFVKCKCSWINFSGISGSPELLMYISNIALYCFPCLLLLFLLVCNMRLRVALFYGYHCTKYLVFR